MERFRCRLLMKEGAWIRLPFAAFFISSATSSFPVDVVARPTPPV
jgi:hypothetical protein